MHSDNSQATVMTSDLRAAIEPQEIFNLLKPIGFTDGDIATATGNQDRTVRRWKTPSGTISDTSAARLSDLRNIVVEMRDAGVFGDRAIVLWLRHDNVDLHDTSPLQLLALGRTVPYVRHALRYLRDPDAGPVQLPDDLIEELDQIAHDSGRGRHLAAVGTPSPRGASA